MRHLQLPRLLAVPALLVLVGLPAGPTAASEAMPAAIQLVLDAAGPSVNVAGKAVDVEPLKLFYQQRENRPVWVEGTELNGRGRALVSSFQQASRDGLDAADYTASATTAAAAPPPHTVEQWAVTEVGLSAALLRYASDVRRGRAVPVKMDRFQRITPKSIDAGLILASAADAVDLKSVMDTLPPTDPYYQGLRQTLAGYRAIADAGGWPLLPDGPKLVPGESDARVPVLRHRLKITGDLGKTTAAPSSIVFDEPLRQAVTRFQARHGLGADGSVGARTREALNVPVDGRIRKSSPTWNAHAGCRRTWATRT